MDRQIKNINEFMRIRREKRPDDHFFDRKTLRFFGERISEMRLLKTRERVIDISGDVHTCYVISSVQHKVPGGPKRMYHYFDRETLEQVILP